SPLTLSLLQRSPAHRHLHSFPTRRSSDLPPHSGPTEGQALNLRRGARPRRTRPDRPDFIGNVQRKKSPWLKKSRSTGPSRCCSRSEEHTSELQSRENLVCRLLLEKKNKTK